MAIAARKKKRPLTKHEREALKHIRYITRWLLKFALLPANKQKEIIDELKSLHPKK